MLAVDVVTIFPRMLEAPLAEGIVARAVERGLASLWVHDLRDFTDDRHRSVDDAPFGGGPGMVMKAEPFFRAMEAIRSRQDPDDRGQAVVLLSPRGRRFDQRTAERFSRLSSLVLLCGRYEGVDERVARDLASEEVSLGDFVLTGGEVAALAVIEASVRLLEGALGDEDSARLDSFADGLLDHPHFTRPAQVRGSGVPDVLLSGDHGRIRRWRRQQALLATRERRPDLFAALALSAADAALLAEAGESAMELVTPGAASAPLASRDER